MVKVKNLKGTSDNKVPSDYDDWLDFWERKSGYKASQCCYCESKSNLVGAHVKKVGNSDNSWYIVPFCQSCNMTEKEFDVNEKFLVPVL